MAKILTKCCVCDKHKFTKKSDGSTVWMHRSDCVIPGYKTAMETMRVSHGYCPPCKGAAFREMEAYDA